MSWSFLDFTGLSHFFGKLPEKMVTTDTTQTISGTKSFSSTILGSVSGSAASAAKDGAGNVIADTYETKADAATHLSKSDAAGTYLSKTDAASAYVQTAAVDQTVAGTKTFSKPIVGSVTGSSGSCTGNAATATKATQDSDGNKITTTYSKNVHTHDDRYYTETEVNNLLNGKANTSGTYSNLTVGNAGSATNATYANWLRASSHSDHLFHTEWDNAGYFWTYVTAGDGGYRAVRVARSDSSATATKLATAHTIALSGAATGTATAFDGSGNITIPVTALASSAIRAQWYAAYPDGAEAHNAMWGGRDITAAFNNGTVSANIANGTFRDIFPGDYITKSVTISGTAYTVNWVVADCDYWINKGDTAVTTHHVVIVPQAPIFNANMNATNTTEGGYMGSRMFKETIPACATGIVNAFGASHILTFRDWLISGMTPNQISSGLPNFTGGAQWGASPWVSVQCDLMTEKMVLGAPVNSASALDEWCATRQMSAFRLSEKLINYNRQGYWLRNIVSSAYFAVVVGYGTADANAASSVLGVRPFALLV